MSEEQVNIEDLILLYLSNELTAEQEAVLNAWKQQSVENRQLFDELTNQATLREKLVNYHALLINKEQGKKLLLEKEFPGATIIDYKPSKRRWTYWAAAAVFVLASISVWLLLSNRKKEHAEIVSAQQRNNKEIAPGGNKAILTLSDNSKIVIDEAQDGSLAKQGNTAITKEEGVLTYNAGKTTASSAEVLYNTISTPRGGQFHVILPDGSNVWLDAASSIHFPAQFTGKERRVEIAGEVYMEVAHATLPGTGERIPFKVSVLSGSGKQLQEIEVLGTHFNINAYDDEPGINTTLLEGRVKVAVSGTQPQTINHKPQTVLKPGEQAQLIANGTMKVVNDVDVDAVVAWKNGNFSFKDATIETIMRNARRWYNVDVQFEGTISSTFEGEIPRKVPLQSLLKILESTDRVHFIVEGRTIVVKP